MFQRSLMIRFYSDISCKMRAAKYRSESLEEEALTGKSGFQDITFVGNMIQADEDNSRYFESRIDNRNHSRWVLRPSDPFRTRWDMFVILLAGYTSFALPYQLSFSPDSLSSIASLVVNSLISMSFTLNILLNFRTSFIQKNSGDEVFDTLLIAINYIKSGLFFIDLLACLPLDMISAKFTENDGKNFIAIISFIRIVSMYRLSQIITNMRFHDDIKIVARLCLLLLCLALYVHCVACIWHIIVEIDCTWIPPTDGMTTDYYDNGGSLIKIYMYSLYNSVYFLRGVETNPSNTREVYFLILILLVGAIISAIMFGQMANLMSNLYRNSNRFAEIMNTAQTTMKNIKLEERLQLKVCDYLIATQNVLARQEEFERFTSLISPSLQQEVNEQIYRHLTTICPLMQANKKAANYIIQHLQHRFLRPETALTIQGDEGKEFFYVVQGSCHVSVFDEFKQSHIIRVLHVGEYFGELSLIYNIKRTASVHTVTYTSVAFLSEEDFVSIITSFTDTVRIFKKEANKYNDHWKHFVITSLMKVPYFKSCSERVLNELIYAMEYKVLDMNYELFKKNTVADRLYIIAEGKLRLLFNVNTKLFASSFARSADFSDNEEDKKFIEFAQRKKRTHTKIQTILSTNTYGSTGAPLKLESLGVGCVLCARQALVGAPIQFSCVAAEPTAVYSLSIKKLEQLCSKYSKLKWNIESYKQELQHVENGEVVRSVPLIDVAKNFIGSKQGLHGERSWLTRLKFKNKVLTIILRKRNMRLLSFENIKGLVLKLKAVEMANERGYPELARKIARGDLDADSVKSIGILNYHEMSNPLLTQFASKAAAIREINESIKSRLKELLDKLTKRQLGITSIREIFKNCRILLN